MASYIFQKPWLWSDLASGYDNGHLAVQNAIISARKLDLTELIQPAVLALANFGLANSISMISQSDLAKQSLRTALIATIGMNVIIFHLKPSQNEKIQNAIWNYTPQTLAILNAALVILGTKEKPIRTCAYTVTVIMSTLQTYKKLPDLISQIWSNMPWVTNGLKFYDGNKLFAALGFASLLLKSDGYLSST